MHRLHGRGRAADAKGGPAEQQPGGEPLGAEPEDRALRSVVTTTPGWSSCQSARSRSTSAACTAGENPGLGRSGVSSVSGTGLFAHAP